MFTKIKEWYKKRKLSKKELKRILDDIRNLNHSKWYNPTITYKEVKEKNEAFGYGYLKKDNKGNLLKNKEGYYIEEDDDFICKNLFKRLHPNLDYEYYDGPFYAYPTTDKFNINLLSKKDRGILTQRFRELVYKD